ncbi:MAG: SPFH domain-containing protein [Pseudomonadota bacterium]
MEFGSSDLGLGIFEYVVLAFVFFAVIFIFLMVKVVPQGFHHTVERFGRYDRTLTPGLNFIIPFFESIGSKMNMMEQVLDVPTQEVITRDNATCSVDGVTFFQVLDASKASYKVSDLELSILNLTMTNLRTVMGSMDLDELLSKRDEINARILHVVDDAVSPWGIKMTRIEVKDINPPTNIVDAMARQMKAEREKRAQVLEAEGERQAAILRAEGEKQSLILEAEGQKEAAFRDAEARERMAQAEAEATRMVSKAIGDGNSQAINYFVAQKYTEALKSIGTADNQKVIMMPMEATALIGSLGGVTEIAKAAFGNGSAPDDPGPWDATQRKANGRSDTTHTDSPPKS